LHHPQDQAIYHNAMDQDLHLPIVDAPLTFETCYLRPARLVLAALSWIMQASETCMWLTTLLSSGCLRESCYQAAPFQRGFCCIARASGVARIDAAQ
jgi:hypothetical protein